MPRVLIIGIDGGTFDLIKPWADSGHLPVIAGILRNGSHGYLRSTMPPMTFPAWNAFMTGKNPGKHGVFDFTEREHNSYSIKFTNALNRKSKTIWQTSSDYGKTVASIGVPLTYPPERINGIVISGFDAPGFNKGSVYPSELYYEIKKNVGDYYISPDIAKYIDSDQIDRAVETILFTLRQNARVAKYIMKLRQWDCFMVVFKETDIVCHHFWQYHDHGSPHRVRVKKTLFKNPVLSVYKELDKAIGELIDIAGEDTVRVILSDHGFGGTGDRVIYLNKWLRTRGLLEFKNKNQVSNQINFLSINKTFSKLKTIGTRIIPAELRKKLLYSKKVGIVKKIESTLRFSYIDWAKTYAYSEETPYYPTIWINLRGREPEGIVDPEDYDELLDRIIKEILAWKEKEGGNHLVENVFKREEIYHGDYIEKIPDLIIEWNLDKNGYSYLSRTSYTTRDENPLTNLNITEDTSSRFLLGRSGSHRTHGIFMASGEMIKQGNKIKDPSLVDIAPLVLYLLGVPIPEDMDGTVLTDMINTDYVKKYPAAYSGVSTDSLSEITGEKKYYTEDEEETIKERLKGLGYIE